MKDSLKFQRRTFKNNEEYFRFINKYRGKIKDIIITWKDNRLTCKYKLKEERSESDANPINDFIDTFINNFHNTSPLQKPHTVHTM